LTTRTAIYKSVLRSIVFNKKSGFKNIEERIRSEYKEYLSEKQCPVCGKRFDSGLALWNHLLLTRHLDIIVDELLRRQYLIWDYRSGEIIDPITGEVVERIYTK